MTRSNSLKNFTYVTTGKVIGASLQAVFYLMFAAMLEPEDYGLMTYLIALAGTFSVLSRFGLPFTAVVYQSKGNYALSNQANILALITTSIAAILLLPINQYAALLCLALSFFTINMQNLLGLKEYKKFLGVHLLKSISIVIIPLFLYFVFEIPGILLGMAIGNFLASSNFFRSLRKQVNSFRDIRTNFKVVIHNFSVDVSSNLLRSIDKLVIVPLYGFVPVALYQLNLQIMLVVAILPMSLYSYLLPEESSGKKHTKISLIVIVASTLIALSIVFLSPYIINQFLPKYSDGISGLQIIIISVIPISISSILNSKLQAKESVKVGFGGIVKIGALLGLIVVLGGNYGIVGLSISVLISQSLETVFLSVLYYKSKMQKFQ